MRKTIAIIPARGGSVRIPRKNIKHFFGKPIILYSIYAALTTRLFDKIYVSTDDLEIAELARCNSCEVIWRPKDDGVIGTQEVVARALMEIPCSVYDYVCCIYPTAPLMSVEDLERGLLELYRRQDFTMAVGTDPLRDAGQFYWGRVKNFLNNAPLISSRTAMIPIDEKRVCDINTPEDWAIALAKYEALQNE